MIGNRQYTGEVVHQQIGPRVGEWLEHRPDLVVVHPLGRLEGDLQLPGMMAVIIGNGDAHILAVDLKAALGAVEALDLP